MRILHLDRMALSGTISADISPVLPHVPDSGTYLILMYVVFISYVVLLNNGFRLLERGLQI